MTKRKVFYLLWLLLTSVYAAYFVTLWIPHIDPLMGLPVRALIQGVILGAFAISLALYLLFYLRRWWKILGILPVIVALFIIVPPVPSMSAIPIEIENAKDAEAEVAIKRTDIDSRFIRLKVPAHQTITYITAPGEWSFDETFTVEQNTQRLVIEIPEFFDSKVLITAEGIRFEKK